MYRPFHCTFVPFFLFFVFLDLAGTDQNLFLSSRVKKEQKNKKIYSFNTPQSYLPLKGKKCFCTLKASRHGGLNPLKEKKK